MSFLPPLPPDEVTMPWRKWFSEIKRNIDILLNKEDVSVEGLATQEELAAQVAAMQASVTALEDFFLEDDGEGGFRIKQELLDVTQGQISGGSLVVGTSKNDDTRLFRSDFYDTDFDYFEVTAILPTSTGTVELRRQYDNDVTPSTPGYVSLDVKTNGEKSLSTGALPMSFMSNSDSRFRVLQSDGSPTFLSCDWIVLRW